MGHILYFFHKRKVLVVLFLLGVLAGIGLFSSCQNKCYNISNTSGDIHREVNVLVKGPKEFATPCKRDVECIRIDLPPCGCSAGGRATAILGTKKAVFTKYMNRRSPKMLCTQNISNDPTCGSNVTAACINNHCALVRVDK